MGYGASGNYVTQNMEQYEEAIKKFEDKMNDKLADERIEKGFWTLFGGTMSVIAGAVLIVATAGMATPIVVGAFTVGSISMLYGLSNSEEGANSISLDLKGDGSTVALNPIRDTLFTNNPELYYRKYKYISIGTCNTNWRGWKCGTYWWYITYSCYGS